MLNLTPLPSHTRADQAVTALRDVILSGVLEPGTRLRETELSAELRISRGPLREALQRLEEEGLVERHSFKGSFVAEVSDETVSKIEAIRAVLEPHAVAMALESLREGEGRACLVAAVEELEVAARLGSVARSMDAHLAVHRALYAASGSKPLLDIWDAWQRQIRLYIALDHRRHGDLRKIAAAHRYLVSVIEGGDQDEIRSEMASHFHSPSGEEVAISTPDPTAE